MILTVPNILSLVRLGFGGLFMVCPCKGLEYSILLIIIAMTDYWDGWWARRFQSTSALGMVLDPLADKVFINALWIRVLYIEEIFWLGLLILGRDIIILMGAGVWVRAKKNYPAPLAVGKWSTMWQMVWGVSLYMNLPHSISFVLSFGVVVWTLVSLGAYAHKIWALKKENL